MDSFPLDKLYNKNAEGTPEDPKIEDALKKYDKN